MSFKKILCAVDFSEASIAAFNRAADLAHLNSADLFVLHALEVQPLVSQWIAPDGLSDLTMEIENKAQAAMDHLKESAHGKLQGLELHTEITAGRAFTEILENARVWEADLIVMGAAGAGALEDAVLGSTVGRVLDEAECSVLVVKGV